MSLKQAVSDLLVSKYAFTNDEADEMVEDSYKEHDDLWHTDADPVALAEFLASDEND